MLTECMDFLCFEPCETDKMSRNCPEKISPEIYFFLLGPLKLHTLVDHSLRKNWLNFQGHGIKGEGHAATTITIL